MKLVLQRTHGAEVTVDRRLVGKTGPGLMVLAGFGKNDALDLAGSPLWNKMIDKMIGLRIFPDEQDRMNVSLENFRGDIMLVSQFTLYADCKKGRRPSFTDACPPDVAEQLFSRLVDDVSRKAPGSVATGVFGAMMDVSFTNWGPVTIMLEDRDLA